MSTNATQNNQAPEEPVKIHIREATGEALVFHRRQMLGIGNFEIRMGHDVYSITSEEAIDRENLIQRCRVRPPTEEEVKAMERKD